MNHILKATALRVLKQTVSVTIFAFQAFISSANADELSDCKVKLNSLAVEAREKYVLSKSIITDDLLKSLLSSQGDGWGSKTCNEHITETFMIVYHEGVHMIDLNYTSPDQITAANAPNHIEDFKKRQPKFYLPSGEFLSVPFPDLPMPSTIYSQYWLNHGISMHAEASEGFVSRYETYAEDPTTLVSKNFLGGLTELNAYTHGTLSSRRLVNHIGQAHGVLFFLGLTKIYLSEIKKSYPKSYTMIVDDSVVKSFVSTLFSNGVHSLEQFGICEKASDPRYKDIYRDLRTFGDDKILSEVVGATTVRKLHDVLSCLK